MRWPWQRRDVRSEIKRSREITLIETLWARAVFAEVRECVALKWWEEAEALLDLAARNFGPEWSPMIARFETLISARRRGAPL